jgi:hypothetical protein
MQSLFSQPSDPTEDRSAFIGSAVGVTLLLAGLLAAQLLTSPPDQIAAHIERPTPIHNVR